MVCHPCSAHKWPATCTGSRTTMVSHATAAPLVAHPAPSRRKSRALPQILRALAIAIGLVIAGVAVWRYTTSRAGPAVRTQTVAVDHGPIAAKVTASGA